MEVWDPKDENTVFSQIKNAIAGLYQGLRSLPGRCYPGNLVFKVKDCFYAICETYGSKISNWGWHKRWNKRNRNKEDWWERHKSFIKYRKKFPYYPEKNKK